MAPRNQDEEIVDEVDDRKGNFRASQLTNSELVPDAGKVHTDEGQPWGVGIIGDIKRTVGTHWVTEFTNFNQKTVAVTLLIFISVIAPTLTFGAVYGKETNNQIGAVETILATAWVGVCYALIGGMPLVSPMGLVNMRGRRASFLRLSSTYTACAQVAYTLMVFTFL